MQEGVVCVIIVSSGYCSYSTILRHTSQNPIAAGNLE